MEKEAEKGDKKGNSIREAEPSSELGMNYNSGRQIWGKKQSIDTAWWSAFLSKPNTFLSEAVRSQIRPGLW